jgi:hypothetical protein
MGAEMQGSDAVDFDHLYNAVIVVALVDQAAIIFVHKDCWCLMVTEYYTEE